MKITYLEKKFLLDCYDNYTTSDCTGLWTIVWTIREENFIEEPVEQKKLTIELIRKALAANWIFAGDLDLDNNSFTIWADSEDEIIERINRKWNDLDKELFTGDVAWFKLTPDGIKFVEEQGLLPSNYSNPLSPGFWDKEDS